VFALCISSFSFAQRIKKRGEIVDTVAVTGTLDESFALYLPTSYKETKPHPIIFIFDPAARAKSGLLPFIESAEKHGIILVCSNNSKNGPFKKSFTIAENLFKHVFKNYVIDVTQMYLSGFSGGSRLASAIAVLSNQFTGVIGCGAGFSFSLNHRPFINSFSYVGICGVEDMNYQEMLNNKRFLAKLNFKNTLFSFNGGHKWPDKREINRAINWLFLQEQKKNGNQFSKDSLKQLLTNDYNLTTFFLENNELLLAEENYKRILSTYPKTIGLDSIRTEYTILINSKPFIISSKERTEALELENRISKKLHSRLQSDFNSNKEINFKWWKKEAEKLNQLKKKGHKEIKRMVSRIKSSIVASVYEKNYPWFLSSKDTTVDLVKVYSQMFYADP